MNPFKHFFKSADKADTRPRPGLGTTFLFGGTTSGKYVNERTAMQTAAVYACVRLLSETVASLPFQVYRNTGDGVKEKAVDHPLYTLLHSSPNPEMTSYVFRETLMSHLLLWGNAYAQIIRNGRGDIVTLYPLLPDRMRVTRAINGEIVYEYNSDYGGLVILPREDVFHIPGLGFDGLVGYSPIAMVKNAIGMAIATEEFGSKFFSNGAVPGGVLEFPGVLKDPTKVRESWHATHSGSQNAGRIAVLEEGMKYQQVGVPPEDAQFLETRKFQLNEIARIYRVPPHMIGDLERASFNNIEQQSLEFVKYTIDPWLVRWEQSVQHALFTEAEKKVYFSKLNTDGLLRGDYKSRMEGYSKAIQNGWMSPNDIRMLEDLNKIEGGDVYAMNGNMKRLEDIGDGI